MCMQFKRLIKLVFRSFFLMKRGACSQSESTEHASFNVGEQVRIVNLPAYPGLEGLAATIRKVDDVNSCVDVELQKTGAVKRLKLDKVRRVISKGSIVELHGLVAAYKLNGHLGQVEGFDWDMQRYELLLGNGTKKKVKPENARFLGLYTESHVDRYHMGSLSSDYPKTTLHERCELMKKWERPIPMAISSKVLRDWAKLDDAGLRWKLIESKRVSVDSLTGSNVKVIYLSWPRLGALVSDDACVIDNESLFVKFCNSICGEDNIESAFGCQIYFVLPMAICSSLKLPAIKLSMEASMPLIPWLCGSMLVVLDKGDYGIDSMTSQYQTLDVHCAFLVNDLVSVYVWDGKHRVNAGNWTKSLTRTHTGSIPQVENCGESLRKLLSGLKLDNAGKHNSRHEIKYFSIQ